MTKVDIISGFLGAGKTTLIAKLLKEGLAGEQVVLIENEFGEIGIDGGFLKESGVEIREMNSGCICCSLVGDFGTSLKEVVEKYHPDRIIIEPSGVGKLSDVIKAVKDLHIENEIRLNSASTVADASKVKVYMKNFGEFFNNQIEHAGTIILSRTQNVSEAKLKTDIELIRSLNKDAHIITTPWDDIDGKQILDAMENVTNLELEMLAEAAAKVAEEHEHHHHHDGECGCGHHHEHGHHHADEVFTSWGKETPKKFTEEGIRAILDTLSKEDSDEYGIILRAKGIVPDENGKWIHFDLVPGEDEVRYGSAEYTGRICVIGSKLNEDKLAELFGL